MFSILLMNLRWRWIDYGNGFSHVCRMGSSNNLHGIYVGSDCSKDEKLLKAGCLEMLIISGGMAGLVIAYTVIVVTS